MAEELILDRNGDFELCRMNPCRYKDSGLKYHSLLAETVQNGGRGTIMRFREFISFDSHRTYPCVAAVLQYKTGTICFQEV